MKRSRRKSTQLVRLSLAAIVVVILGGALTPLAAQGQSTIEQNKAMARRWSEELWSRGNLAVADEIIAADYQRHDPGDPFPARGPEDVKRIVTMLRSMLPDFHIEVEAMMAEGDFVVSRYTATATDTRGYMGMPPTGKSDPHARDSDLPLREREDRRELGGTRRSWDAAAARAHPGVRAEAIARTVRDAASGVGVLRSRTSRRAAPAAAGSPAS